MGKINNIDYAEAANELLKSHEGIRDSNVILTTIPYMNGGSD